MSLTGTLGGRLLDPLKTTVVPGPGTALALQLAGSDQLLVLPSPVQVSEVKAL